MTCTTTAFSVFGLFATYVPPVEPPSNPGVTKPPVKLPGVTTPEDVPEEEVSVEDPGYVSPRPVPQQSNEEKPGETEGKSSLRSIGTAISSTVKAVAKRPVWALGVLLFVAAGITLFCSVA